MIQIQNPEVENLLMARLHRGKFPDVEQALLQALRDAPFPDLSSNSDGPSGEEIIAAFQRCPVPDFNFDHPGVVMPISDPVKF